MIEANGSSLPELLEQHEREVLDEWLAEMSASGVRRDELMQESELRAQAKELLTLLSSATRRSGGGDLSAAEAEPIREFLDEITRTRAQQGFTPSQIATFVFSVKKPIFSLLRRQSDRDNDSLLHEIWTVTELIDRLGLMTSDSTLRSRESIIRQQQEEMLELSTPVVKLWHGVLALPLIGTLDSARTQVVMETLLERIVETSAEIAIIDITGVPMVDTLVAQHLLKTITAARLMGADCIISGIRPQIAQTIVHLGVDLQDIVTKASLADALSVAMKRVGFRVVRPSGPPAGATS